MNNEGIFARRERIDSEIREAKKDLIREKRANRELRKLQSGGRVTPFLRREADKNQTIAAAVNLATAGNPLALGQAMIQYQAAINESKRDPLKTENNPRPESPKEDGGGGGGGACVGLALYTQTVGTPPDTTIQVWVGAGTVAGEIPSGFDPTSGKNIANGGSGFAWAEVNIDENTGEIISVAVTGSAEVPENTSTAFYYTLGAYSYSEEAATVTNYGCGSLDVTVCRNWFAGNPPFYGVAFSRRGSP